MATTTPAEVKAITGSNADDAVVQVFIDAANCSIEAASACANVSDDCENLALRFLAAHLLSGSPVGKDARVVRSEQIEDMYRVTFETMATGEGVNSSAFGQQANRIMKGCLAELDKIPIDMEVIGCD